MLQPRTSISQPWPVSWLLRLADGSLLKEKISKVLALVFDPGVGTREELSPTDEVVLQRQDSQEEDGRKNNQFQTPNRSRSGKDGRATAWAISKAR